MLLRSRSRAESGRAPPPARRKPRGEVDLSCPRGTFPGTTGMIRTHKRLAIASSGRPGRGAQAAGWCGLTWGPTDASSPARATMATSLPTTATGMPPATPQCRSGACPDHASDAISRLPSAKVPITEGKDPPIMAKGVVRASFPLASNTVCSCAGAGLEREGSNVVGLRRLQGRRARGRWRDSG